MIRHAISEVICSGIVNVLLVTDSAEAVSTGRVEGGMGKRVVTEREEEGEDATSFGADFVLCAGGLKNEQLTRIHDNLFSREYL